MDSRTINLIALASVQALLSRRSRLPSAVDPEPLVGVAADVVFENFRHQLSVRNDVGFAVFRADYLHRGIEAQTIFLQTRVPDGESRDDGGIGLQRDASYATRGAGRVSEEVNE